MVNKEQQYELLRFDYFPNEKRDFILENKSLL